MATGSTRKIGSNKEIHKTLLKGHRAPVLCVAHSSSAVSSPQHEADDGYVSPMSSSCCLISGSEDGTARLWDLRISTRASVCIVAPSTSSSKTSEVSSVAFLPQLDGGCGSSESPFSKNCTIYLSTGNEVYGYDLRHISSPIVRDCSFSFSGVLGIKDEINQISFSHPWKGKKRIDLAVADDDGNIHITDTFLSTSALTTTKTGTFSNQNSSRVLRHGEDSLTLATCVGFRPRTKGIELASGGTDCRICLWEATRPRRPLSSIHIRSDDTAANQVCNPPIVHSLSWSPSGRLLAAGLGDGSSVILNVKSRTLVEACRLRGGHDAAIASMLFPGFSAKPSLSSNAAADDRLVISAGNDGAIKFWDLGSDVTGDDSIDPVAIFGDFGTELGSIDIESSDALSSLSLRSQPEIVYRILHSHKPNWLTSSSSSDPILPSSLFVADTSCDISVYAMQLI